MFRRLLLASVCAVGLPLAAHAATSNFAIEFSEAPSASVACVPVTGLAVPVAAGTVVANCTVAPAPGQNWTGSVGISGTGADAFVVDPVSGQPTEFTVNVGSSVYNTVGTVNLTATSAP